MNTKWHTITKHENERLFEIMFILYGFFKLIVLNKKKTYLYDFY